MYINRKSRAVRLLNCLTAASRMDELLVKVLTINVVQKVIADFQANSGCWAEERSLRRKALVKEIREAEGIGCPGNATGEALASQTPPPELVSSICHRRNWQQ